MYCPLCGMESDNEDDYHQGYSGVLELLCQTFYLAKVIILNIVRKQTFMG